MGRPGDGWAMVMPMELWLSPVALGILGLVIGSFLNVVVHRLPQLLEREWLADAAGYLQDSDAIGRVLGSDARRNAELICNLHTWMPWPRSSSTLDRASSNSTAAWQTS